MSKKALLKALKFFITEPKQRFRFPISLNSLEIINHVLRAFCDRPFEGVAVDLEIFTAGEIYFFDNLVKLCIREGSLIYAK